MSNYRLTVAPGVFDLLHVGHLRFLQQARDLADKLVVLVHDDRDVERQKGSPPIVPLRERVVLLSALDVVSNVLSYSSPDLSGVLSRIKPDCLCVAENYGYDPDHQKTLDYCQKHGIDVVRIPYSKEISSTMLKERIRTFWHNRGGNTMLGSFGGDSTSEAKQTAIECELIRKATLPGQTLLDLGCGDGRLSHPLADFFAEIVAVDFSRTLLDQAHQDSPSNIRYFQADAVDFDPPMVCDAALLSGLLPYLDNEQFSQLVERLRRRVCGPLLVRSSIGLKDKVEVVNQSSSVSADAYTAYYHTAGEIITAFQRPAVMDLYNVVSGWSLTAAHELYRHRDDTAVWWFQFDPR